MTLTRLANESPLGDASQFYQVKKQSQGAILDIPDKGILELYPAGYTKPSNRDGISRQETYQLIWEAAVQLQSEEELFPFGKDNHNVRLLHDPENPYDKNALHLILEAKDGPLVALNGRDLGFIPKKINQNVLRGINLIHGGRIFKVRSKFHTKYYSLKVVLGYGANTFSKLSVTSLSRFAAILEE